MQHLGNTKGGAFWPFDSILSRVQSASVSTTPKRREPHNEILNWKFSDLPLRRTFRPEAAGVNGLNHIHVGDDGGMPLQFLYEEADLRMFFTREMLTGQEKVWGKVAEIAFGREDQKGP